MEQSSTEKKGSGSPPPVVSEAAAKALGRASIPHEASEGGIILTEMEERVMHSASLGGTLESVSAELSEGENTLSEKDVEDARNSIIEKFGVKNMAAVISLAILQGRIKIDVEERAPYLSQEEKVVLSLIAQGQTNATVAGMIGKSRQGLMNNNKVLFKKIGATGRTHSVRRAYELGIFKVS